MPQDTNTHVALVTGAAQGIGRAIARRLVDDGYHVCCIDRDSAALDDMKATLGDGVQERLSLFRVDVGSENEVEACLKMIATTWQRLDVLVNNAGIADPFNGPIESLALADWERVIRVNLTGYFLLAKHAVPLLREVRGCIVNMASSRMLQSEPDTEAYAASKGGIEALTHALSISLGPDIRVNGVAPGWIDVRAEQSDADTPAPLRDIDHAQHPVGRVGHGADIAGAVAFLCSADAGFITGQTLVVDGGMTRKMIYEH
ncbi:SDR family oxidoreductase [Salinisphaera aquimarina]|uniref:SDR family oxidoreductase n=1 Tax=Salinisphaera aquimarina TaxID=2094031 RepID=A0ABV7EWY3_9GAMM